MLVVRVFEVIDLERRRANGDFIKHDAPRVEITAPIQFSTLALLRRHIRQCAHGSACGGQPTACRQTCQPKIAYFEHILLTLLTLSALTIEHQVIGLDVAVHYLQRMCSGKTFGRLAHEIESE